MRIFSSVYEMFQLFSKTKTIIIQSQQYKSTRMLVFSHHVTTSVLKRKLVASVRILEINMFFFFFSIDLFGYCIVVIIGELENPRNPRQ